MSDLVDHLANDNFWRHDPPTKSPCWVCGEDTAWIYLDMAYQHPDCDMYPCPGACGLSDVEHDHTIIGGVS